MNLSISSFFNRLKRFSVLNLSISSKKGKFSLRKEDCLSLIQYEYKVFFPMSIKTHSGVIPSEFFSVYSIIQAPHLTSS